jgi:DNA (cytosine-5)-methyltransferase 1
MKPRDYHNENNAFAAQWTRNLMKAGHIPDGFVDERDIRDVQPMDLWGFTRCHFFSGIAGWAYALRLAGVPDDLPLWTGSCPCQPFSAAGQGKGVADDRHLWPAWFKLIKESRPDRVFGEQVEAAIGHGWLDLVFSDLEGQGYACGAAVLPAASVGAPHIRQRLWFVADAGGERRQQIARSASGDEAADGRARRNGEQANGDHVASGDGENSLVANAPSDGRRPRGAERARQERGAASVGASGAGGMADSERGGRKGRSEKYRGEEASFPTENGSLVYTAGKQVGLPGRARQSGSAVDDASGSRQSSSRSGKSEQPERGRSLLGLGRQISRWAETDCARQSGVALGDSCGAGLSQRERDGRIQCEAMEPFEGQTALGRSNAWDSIDWIDCRDGKRRPVEPGTFPLAHGIPARVGKLRAYGNSIVPQVAAAFIEAALACRP